jgi:hypothetical protein
MGDRNRGVSAFESTLEVAKGPDAVVDDRDVYAETIERMLPYLANRETRTVRTDGHTHHLRQLYMPTCMDVRCDPARHPDHDMIIYSVSVTEYDQRCASS